MHGFLRSSSLRIGLILLASFVGGAGSSWAYSYSGYKWSGTSVTYYVDASLPAATVTAIKSSDATWDAAGSKFRFSYGGTKSVCDGTSQVFSYDGGSTGSVGVTSVYASGSTVTMIYTNLNSHYSLTVGGSATSYDIQNTMTHEFGHWLVLADLYSAGSSSYTMYYTESKGETKKRSLESDDKNGIKAIYGT